MAATSQSLREYQRQLQQLEDQTRLRHMNNSPPRFKFWSPPEDPEKPRLPYIPGFTVQISRHVPPSPFGGLDYGMGIREELSESYLLGIKQSELVIDHPAAQTPLPAQSETTQLVVTTPIAIGGVRGPQVVACEITPPFEGHKPFEAVAKIYDPLYYNFDYDFSHQPHDTVWQADSDYSREAAAYEHLQRSATSFAPEYFGSWKFDLPITCRGVPTSRSVRMILIERLDGMCVQNMRVRNDPDPEEPDDAFHYPEDYRLEVLAMAMDGYVRMLHSGVDQKDFASRNVMLVASKKSSGQVPVVSGLPLPRVVLVDYNWSVVYGLVDSGRHSRGRECFDRRGPLPINPMQLWWGMPMNEFVGWVPHEWHHTPDVKREWLKKRFGGTERRKLYTMDQEPDDTSSHKSRASGSHDDKEELSDHPVPWGCIPRNPLSDDMKEVKAELEAKQDAKGISTPQKLFILNANE